MSIANIIRELKYRFYKNRIDFKPVFLIGCGRSGTTILGKTIGQHKAITYLNERRDLWHLAYPTFDIWKGTTDNPQMVADENDTDEDQSKALRDLFHKEQTIGGSKILLEKLPINNFRLGLIEAVFPNARYIYLHRNGLEVANSIEKSAQHGWYREGGSKWRLLNELSKKDTSIPILEYSNYEKALIEWNMSIKASETFFNSIDSKRVYSLSYQSFLENPSFQIQHIYKFLGLEINQKFIDKITKGIIRKSTPLTELSDEQVLLGGENLKKSIENKLRHSRPL